MPTASVKRSPKSTAPRKAKAQAGATSRRPATVTPKTSSKPAAQVRRKATPEPSLRFYFSEQLRAKTLSVLTGIESARKGLDRREAMAGVVVELTDAGMDYYFLRPLAIAKVGFVTEQSARLGMSATTSVLSSVTRKIIARMDDRQLLAVCQYIRELMK